MRLPRHATAAAALVLAGMFSASPSHAIAIIGLVVEGGGTAQIYQLNNGNLLGLWGFDNREGANPGAGAVTITSAADILGGFTSGAGNIVGFYNGTNPVNNAGTSEFDPLVYPLFIADNARLFDSLWVEWTGGNLVYQQPSGGTATMGTTVTREGDPFAVPEPGTAALVGLGLIGMALRRRRAA